LRDDEARALESLAEFKTLFPSTRTLVRGDELDFLLDRRGLSVWEHHMPLKEFADVPLAQAFFNLYVDRETHNKQIRKELALALHQWLLQNAAR
jgi:hypothetical protein